MKTLRSTHWLLFVAFLVTGCYSRGYGLGMGGHYGNGVCTYDLGEVPVNKRALTATDAQAGAKAWCIGGAAYRIQCPGGGVSLVGNSLSGDIGEAWWFDATGHLLGYESWSAVGTCADQRYGIAPDCPATPSDLSLCSAAVDAVSDSGAFDSGASDSGQTAPDVADGGSNHVPDAFDTSAADIPVDNTLCASQADCAADKWCNVTGCGFTMGLCLAKPTDCTGQYGPICGCDGHSYDSACAAQKAGKSIAAYSAPCVGSGCLPACGSGYTCVDCASGGAQCLVPGGQCVGGK